MRISVRTLASCVLVLAACAAQAAPFAYIPHDTGVTVIDVADVTTRNIALDAAPFSDVAVRPGDTRAYVVDVPIHAIEVRTQREVLHISAGNSYFMALSPTEPKAAIFDGNPTTIRFIDTDSRGELAALPYASGMRRGAFNAIGTRFYASDAASVHVIDTRSLQEIAAINVGGTPVGVAPSPSTNRLYVVVADLNAVRVVNLDDNTIMATIPVGAGPSDIVSDGPGARMYVTNRGANTVSVIDTVSGTVIATVPVGVAPEGIDITPDGSAVYVVNSGAGSVSLISTSDLSLVGGIGVGNNPQARGRFIGGDAQAVPPTAPGVLTGLFWNPAESGWGVHLTQRGNKVFAAFFTYGSEGAPRWYTGSSCELTNLSCPTCVENAICTSPLTESHGPDILSDIFNPALVTRGTVGQMRLQFRNADSAIFSYEVNGVGRNIDIQRQVFGSVNARPEGYSDLWWNPNESGWGMGITQQGNLMFITWFVYDKPRNPVWYVASRCEVVGSGDGCTGRLYRVSGPLGPNRTDGSFDRGRVVVEDVGTIRVGFSDANNGQIDYVLHGVAGRKSITRQLF